ncbi:hypothetical protein KIL84_022511 [Mauremys mutica]|uniref:Uncharacterized protein n=1 Tax=Mauremys mutica TaxID=74926 RepID=A0A9D4ALK2_9SAUR|nr:hypothetical protein KIL84_022511 [Mauremys mutica]
MWISQSFRNKICFIPISPAKSLHLRVCKLDSILAHASLRPVLLTKALSALGFQTAVELQLCKTSGVDTIYTSAVYPGVCCPCTNCFGCTSCLTLGVCTGTGSLVAKIPP